MADAHEQEDMEVAENPGESPKMNDLDIIINGKNDEYIKRTVKFGFFSLSKRVIFQPLSSLLL